MRLPNFGPPQDPFWKTIASFSVERKRRRRDHKIAASASGRRRARSAAARQPLSESQRRDPRAFQDPGYGSMGKAARRPHLPTTVIPRQTSSLPKSIIMPTMATALAATIDASDPVATDSTPPTDRAIGPAVEGPSRLLRRRQRENGWGFGARRYAQPGLAESHQAAIDRLP